MIIKGRRRRKGREMTGTASIAEEWEGEGESHVACHTGGEEEEVEEEEGIFPVTPHYVFPYYSVHVRSRGPHTHILCMVPH